MIAAVDFFRHILRTFPNTICITLLVAGISLGQVAWLFVAAGAVVLAMAVMSVQFIAFQSFATGRIPGRALVEACSILPTHTGTDYSNVPSLWMAITSYFAAYILTNAVFVYTALPSSSLKRETTAVAQRKGVGLISMLAVVVLFSFLVITRWFSVCERHLGVLTGLAMGGGFGMGWWWLLQTTGGVSVSDIHGVLRGLSGVQRLGAQACTGM